MIADRRLYMKADMRYDEVIALMDQIIEEHKTTLLDHKWAVRRYLTQRKKSVKDVLKSSKNCDLHKDPILLIVQCAVSPFRYLDRNREQINRDRSLRTLITMCSNYEHVNDIDKRDQTVYYYSNLFNQLFLSGRELFMCYDCGTSARANLFALLREYRKDFQLSPEEIKRIHTEYYMDRYKNPSQGVADLRQKLAKIGQDSIYICALQLGDAFGHIYLIEKIYIDDKPRYRIYQSSFNSYLVIDYIEYMDYARSLTSGIDVQQHLDEVDHIMSCRDGWGEREINIFNKWYQFRPSTPIKAGDPLKFTSTHIVF